MNILEQLEEMEINRLAPLAERMKPNSLDEFYGQENIVGKKSALRRMIVNDKIMSMILYGPSGSGKTSIAKIISKMTNSDFIELNAVMSGISDIKQCISKARDNISFGKRTIVFVDEIHRFNKSQQDVLLPFVENGTIVLIGATTENPFFEVNPALMSRCVLYTLNILTDSDIKNILINAINDSKRGIGNYIKSIDNDAIDLLVLLCNGDARRVLNMLEIVVFSINPKANGDIYITKDDVQQLFEHRKISYDKNGDEHYNVVSAFIKSIRGSDANAALHYLARMLEGGEDIMFITRRLVILASEDIGNANPTAAILASSMINSIKFVGLPEARILLSQLVIYLAKSKKSNLSYIAIDSALNDVRNKKIGDVPNHLKDAHYKSSKKLGHGIGYKYPHDYPNNWVSQQYMPNELIGVKYID